MLIIPQLKKVDLLNSKCDAKAIDWSFCDNVDERVIRAAERICDKYSGIPCYVNHEDTDGEGYTIVIHNDEIRIDAESGAGAFYALMTLKMLINKNAGILDCCEIKDYPDMAYRGFYQDTTRGRIPSIERLKKLVDTMAEYKLNSLQLYVEHSYDFKEYDFCKKKLGYLTKAEIEELDRYCKERFIELIPSLSTFGHLYHLLQSDKYKHLCELKDHKPTQHHMKDRMHHHTINPLLDESFEIITSLIDQHMDAFTSDKFNICCDETFDLGTDVNKGKDKSELYLGFVKRLIAHLEGKGKKVMMWGDIVLQYPDRIKELSDNLIFLNWDYAKEPDEKKFEMLRDKVQIVCPGTSSWEGFCERVSKEEENILSLAKYAAKYDAVGMFNTNWGDIGNLASIDMAMYGLILGAAASWNVNTKADDDFRAFVSDYHYGCGDALNILMSMEKSEEYANWLIYNWDWLEYKDGSKEAFEKAMDDAERVIEVIENAEFKDSEIKREFLIAAKGNSLLIEWSAHKAGYEIKSKVDFVSWLEDYKNNWHEDSKKSELDEVLSIFSLLNNGRIFQ